MLLSSLFVGMSALAAGTLAQTTSTKTTTGSSKATTTSETADSTASSTAVATHTIAVGASGFKFEPNTVNASVGDIIEWRFYPTGHWVVRSEFEQPCIPYEDTGPNKVGFSSGEVDVATTSNNGPTFQQRVNDTDPIFFYCAASGSCVDYHMIGVINPNSTQTYDIQLEYAENVTYQMTPGEAFPSETSSSSSATSSASSSSGSSSSSHHGLSAGAIAGIAIGAAAVLVLAAAIVYLCGRRGGLDKAYNRQGRANRNTFQEPMVGARYVGPKSPGAETFSTTAYTATPSNDPYQNVPGQQAQGLGVSRGLAHGANSISTGSPPPMSEYAQSVYNQPQRYGSPLMSAMNGNGTMQSGFFMAPQAQAYQQPYSQQHPGTALSTHPVELPTSNDPGNSPLSDYNAAQRTFSWANGGEDTYRPTKP